MSTYSIFSNSRKEAIPAVKDCTHLSMGHLNSEGYKGKPEWWNICYIAQNGLGAMQRYMQSIWWMTELSCSLHLRPLHLTGQWAFPVGSTFSTYGWLWLARKPPMRLLASACLKSKRLRSTCFPLLVVFLWFSDSFIGINLLQTVTSISNQKR